MCRYERCPNGARAGMGRCATCQGLAERIEGLVEEGLLPVNDLTRVSQIQQGSVSAEAERPCTVCGRPIVGNDYVFPQFASPRQSAFRGDVHFDKLCHEIWKEVATWSG
jgi:hypothetical protein